MNARTDRTTDRKADGLSADDGPDAMESRILRAMATRANAPRPGGIVDSSTRRERTIAAVVEAGVPKRVTLWSILAEARGSLRLRDLFFGAWDCVAVALVMTATVWMIPLLQLLTDAQHVLTHPGTVYAMAFLTAPFLYGATHLLVRFKEHESRTDELLRTMRWSFTRLCALRMLVTGAAAATLIVGYAAIVGAVYTQLGPAEGGVGGIIVPAARLSLVTLLGVAFSALFVFGIVQLAADAHVRWPGSMLVIPPLWVALCVILLVWNDSLAPLLSNLPPMVALVTAVATGAAYFTAMARFARSEPVRTQIA